MVVRGAGNLWGGLAGLSLGLLIATAGPAQAASQGAYYESFEGIEIGGGRLDNPSQSIGSLERNATNISVGGGFVYWQDGVNIFRSNLDFTGVTLFHHNGIAPTDFVVDPAHDAYYETFAGDEIGGGRLSSDMQGIGSLERNATNVAVGGGFVYWQDGVNIFRANPDLTGVTLFHHNGIAPTDFAIDADHDAYYETFEGIEIGGGRLSSDMQGIGSLERNATNVAVGGGFVYWQDGLDIFRANPDLTGVTLFHHNGLAPTDFAIQPPTFDAPPPGVPEPTVWALMIMGFGAMGAALRRRTLAA
jgi:PEP-CTERM motif